MYIYWLDVIFVLCLLIKHKMIKKLMNSEIDVIRLGMIIVLVISTLFGGEVKSMVVENTEIKFVIDSYYKFENLQDSPFLRNDSKVDVLKRTSFVKFSFIGLRNEQ